MDTIIDLFSEVVEREIHLASLGSKLDGMRIQFHVLSVKELVWSFKMLNDILNLSLSAHDDARPLRPELPFRFRHVEKMNQTKCSLDGHSAERSGSARPGQWCPIANRGAIPA
jgi:hypothetical protein